MKIYKRKPRLAHAYSHWKKANQVNKESWTADLPKRARHICDMDITFMYPHRPQILPLFQEIPFNMGIMAKPIQFNIQT